jgi:acyl-coenzyme A thioesterase PaaI-like protein
MQDTGNEILRFPTDGGCFGCSDRNDSGLKLVFRRKGDELHSDYVIDDRFHGAPGVAHGGIVASILDEISCAAVFFLRGPHVVTGELTVRYSKPCPVEIPLIFHARIVDETHARYAVVEAEARRDEIVLAHSTGRFFYVQRTESVP